MPLGPFDLRAKTAQCCVVVSRRASLAAEVAVEQSFDFSIRIGKAEFKVITVKLREVGKFSSVKQNKGARRKRARSDDAVHSFGCPFSLSVSTVDPGDDFQPSPGQIC